MRIAVILCLCLCLVQISCNTTQEQKEIVGPELSHIDQQLSLLLDKAMSNQKQPRTIHDGKLRFTNKGFDWTEGFFPGTCWYMYELTGEEKWKNAALKLQDIFIDHRFRTTNHDLGFVFNCSFGHGYRLMKSEKDKEVIIDAANALITRFNPAVG